ncbi:MAG: hypothetical protein KGJ60_08870 [Verrucomicrobiota bacterium]|nr:hypothetical protein [Verrucomicrobiota bacterium]
MAPAAFASTLQRFIAPTLSFVWVFIAFAPPIRAADTNSPPPMTPQQLFEGGTNTYTDWIELSTGGFLTRGNGPQAEEIQHWHGGAFGGIEDLHLRGNAFTNVTLTLDGHSIFDQHDYDVKLRLERPEKWFLQFHFDNFRTWSDDLGGFYPPTGMEYSRPGGALALDRGEFTFEGGLTLEKLPALTFKYTHRYRDGDKSSTIWGPVHPDPLNAPAAVRGLSPSFYDLDETVDAFDLNATKHVKATDLGLGLHYEHGDLNNALDETFFQGEPNQRDVTDRQKTTYDLFSVNATSETWFKNNLMLSAGGMFANLDNDFSGSRIYGNDFDVAYSPVAYDGLGYTDLTGDSHLQEYVMDLNLLALPVKTLSIIPAVRVQKESWDADSGGTGTFSDGTVFGFGDATGPFNEQSSRDVIDVCESLDLRYTGLTNWVFSLRGQWDQGDGSLKENGGIGPTNGFDPYGTPPVNNETDDGRFFQKYSLNARWYPLRRLIVDAGGYYKDNKYTYHFPVDGTPNNAPPGEERYPGYLTIQRFQTYDGNLRLTLRPLQNVSLTSRYEYQWSVIHTAPDPASGEPETESSIMTSHIIGQDIGWIPWSRLSLQAGFNYVLSETETPASGYIPPLYSAAPILAAQNNYWTLNFSSSLVLDDKTDLNLNYFYYQAEDYQDNSSAGVPLGAGAHEHGVTATLTRQLNPHLRLNLKYGYYNYADALTGGHSNFEAHLIFGSLQYRF